MATTNERKALWFLALVVLSGSAVRLWQSRGGKPVPTQVAALDRQLGRVDSARVTPRTKKPRPVRKDTVRKTPSIVDLDRANVAQIESLPGIGPALADRIVRHRDSAGAFGSVEALCGVRGIGPALAERLRPLVTFTGPRRPLSDECGDASVQTRKSPAARRRQPR
ncbi:MAG TPA: helix-hairpin-helix domain-containing protein [Gemmatimonadaceae bacterium]|nr:helix-hairpin-helix domain-containing protein [Gemmatimonadaceae bacterium]